MKKVYIVGIGMDGNSTLTQQARAAIGSADCLIGAARMLEPFSALSKPCFTSWNSGEIAGYILDSGYDKFAVLMSGDCGYFSGAEGLLMALPDSVRAEVISGISSPVYFCGKLGIPWQDIPTVNLHGESANIARNAAMHRRCFFLLGGKSGAREVCRRLCEYGLGGMTVHIGERLGYPQERVISGTAEGFTDIETDRLSVMLTENPAPETHIRTGIPDEEFIRDKVPMTKSEVRALVISRLGICPGDTMWDIGCGTGSVSVEMALQCYRGAVYSIDVKPEAAELTRRNAVKFHCDNIIVRTGSAPRRYGGFSCTGQGIRGRFRRLSARNHFGGGQQESGGGHRDNCGFPGNAARSRGIPRRAGYQRGNYPGGSHPDEKAWKPHNASG